MSSLMTAGIGGGGVPVGDVERERQKRKQELALAFRIFGRLGFSEGVAGHITVRDPGTPDSFWVNPYGLNFSDLSVSDLLLVDHNGDVLAGDRPVNRAAFCIHSQVHKARPDAIAAVHAHSPSGKAFASLGIRLDPITQDACAFYQDHSLYADYGGVVTDLEEGRRIGQALGSNKAVVLQNHGLLTVGGSVAEAAWWFISMERSCEVQLKAMSAGTPLLIKDEVAAGVAAYIGGPRSAIASFKSLRSVVAASDAEIYS
jgi:ribulose-5-phosphate 4-epimerase/fuculose-1-phosphate aldolase